MWDARESRDRRIMEMREKEGLIPCELKGYEDVVFDGYCNSTETKSFGLSLSGTQVNSFRKQSPAIRQLTK
jgi:hypothetical protein